MKHKEKDEERSFDAIRVAMGNRSRGVSVQDAEATEAEAIAKLQAIQRGKMARRAASSKVMVAAPPVKKGPPASGLKWYSAGPSSGPIDGVEILCDALADSLNGRNDFVFFSRVDWEQFGIDDLRMDEYIESGGYYFRPALELATVEAPAPAPAPAAPRTPTFEEKQAAAIMRLQAAQRGKSVRQSRKEQEAAAVKLQAIQRGKETRVLKRSASTMARDRWAESHLGSTLDVEEHEERFSTLIRHRTSKRLNLQEIREENTEDTFLGVVTELYSIAEGKHFNAISRLGFLPCVVHLSHVGVGSPAVQYKATATVARLATQDSYRETLAEAGAIPPLKEIVDAHTTTSDEEQEEITLVALEALRNLARSHKMKEVLRVGGFTEAIIQLLKEGRDSAVSAAAVGVVRNLAVSPFNQEVLRKAGAIPLLIDFLHFGASSDSAAAAAAALGNLAIDSESNKEAIHKSGALDALIALLKMTNPDSNWQPTAGAAKAADALKSLAVNSNENKKVRPAGT